MTRYNIIVLDEAFFASDDHVKVPDIERIFDTLDRAPWWEEVEVGYEFMPDEPYHSESPHGSVSEHIATHTFTVLPVLKNTYFRDTRWQPPVKPLAVGDVIETVEDLERLPFKAVLTDCDNYAWQKVGLARLLCVTSDGFYTAEAGLKSGPFTVVHLPKTEATE